MSGQQNQDSATPRKRLKREDRRNLLLDLAADILATRGSDALTLQTLAEAAGVTKPVTYSQFGTRMGLLLALYRRCDQRLFADLEAGMAHRPPTPRDAANMFADSYIACIIRHGRVYEATIAALRSYPEHGMIGTEIRTAFCDMLTRLLAPCFPAGDMPAQARMIALFGAVEELARALLDGQISEHAARTEMRRAFEALVTPEA